MSNNIKFEEWNKSIGDMIASIDTPAALSALLDGISQVVGFNLWYVAFFRREAPPIEVGYSYSDTERERYVEGPYLLDPFYNAYIEGEIEPGCHAMRDLAPPDFKSSEFFLGYYAPWGDGNEVAFVLPLDDQTAAHVSMTRLGKGMRFSANEMRTLNQMSPIVKAVMERIWQRMRPEIQTSDRFNIDFHVRMSQAFRMFGTSVLTSRESEITHFLLKGHSAKSIARLLDISPGTVRNHMKSIYSKLEISSQSELFGLFFEALSHAGGDITSDPLSLFMKG